MNKKTGTKKVTKLPQTVEVDNVNKYLAAGNGRGRLNSAASVYNGHVGYFFVGNIVVGGVKQEAILFSCDHENEAGIETNEDIVITEFPAHPKYYVKKE